MHDKPGNLKNQEVRATRLEILEEDHIKPLKEFVLKIRKEKNLSDQIPFFDPLDGGVNARCLSVLRAPGDKTQETGFVSRNNPDPTANNLFHFYQEAKIPREETVLWNVVPWKVKEEKFWESLDQSVEYLLELIDILPKLKVIVLHGNEAKKARDMLERANKNIIIIDSWHTGSNLNRHPHKKDEIRKSLQEAYKSL